MDQLDRGLRQKVAEKMATDESKGYGPSKRGRGSIALGLVLLVVFVVALLVINPG